jgi:hypothetical protein
MKILDKKVNRKEFLLLCGKVIGAFVLGSIALRPAQAKMVSFKDSEGTVHNIFDTDDLIKTHSPSLTIDGGGDVISTGSKGFTTFPYTGTIAKWWVVSDQSGSIVIDIKKNGSSIINAGNKPTLSSEQRAEAVPTSWDSTTITEEDELEFVVDSASTVTRVNLVLKVTEQ